MARYTGKIKMVILDIAGTVCDGPQDLSHLYPNDDGKGVKAPVLSFEKIFQKRDMDIDWATIRKPLGLFKKEHLHELLKDAGVAAEFKQAHGRDWRQRDLDEMFAEFRPIVAEIAVTDELVRPIEGLKRAVDEMRAAGIVIACDTGYPVEAASAIYAKLADEHDVVFDVVADSETVTGRPSPFLVFDCMNKANVYPPEAVVKADDIEAGMFEGRNAGAWTVGLYATGEHDRERLGASQSAPDFLVPSAGHLPQLVFGEIEPRLIRGELPGQAPTQAH